MTVDTRDAVNRIALIGFGEVGQMLARELSASGDLQFTTFDIAFAQEDSPQLRAARSAGLVAARSAGEAVADAEIVISAVTASSALEAAASVAPGWRAGTFFLDLNSVAPETKRAAAAIIEGCGGRYVEAAVMAPVSPKRLRTPILLGGPHARTFLGIAEALGFNVATHSDKVGTASAVKMCRSVMIKGLEALTLECLVAARSAGVEADVLASLRESFPSLDWPTMAIYNLERMSTHGVRRSEEMREVAKTVQELGFAPHMSRAIAEHQSAVGQLKVRERCGGSYPKDLEGFLDAIARALSAPKANAQAAE